MLTAMLKVMFFTLFIFSSMLTYAEDVTLLAIPLGDGTTFDYKVDTKKECSFEGVTDIFYPSFEQAQKRNFILDKLSFFQKKLNLEIDKREITNERITFSLKGS